MKPIALAGLFLFALAAPALADDDVFADGKEGAKVHIASGYVCPQKIGRFERDAVGMRDPATGKDYCSYAARDGVYGIVMLSPLTGNYDPKALMAPEFQFQEGTRGRLSEESTQSLGPGKALPAYVRIYDAAKVEAMRYRTFYACAAVGNWVVSVGVEYGDPRDKDLRDDFLNHIYGEAMQRFVTPPSAPVP